MKMKAASTILLSLAVSALPLGCTSDDDPSTGSESDAGATSNLTPGTDSSANPSTSGTGDGTDTGGDTEGETSGTSGSTESTGDATDTNETSDTNETNETNDTTTTTTGFVPTVGDGVFLYTGAGGDNYDTSAEALESLYADAGIGVTRSDVVDGDVTAEHGCLVLLNPTADLPGEVVDAAQAMVDGGGRVVFQTEHSNYGGHGIANALLEELGSSIRSLAESRSGWAMVDIAQAPPLTDGVDELAPFYVARVEVGAGEAIATLTGEDWVVIARENVSEGEVVVVGDGSMFGYSLDSGNNEQFMLNFAEL